jgi:hypothetical protein
MFLIKAFGFITELGYLVYATHRTERAEKMFIYLVNSSTNLGP